MGAVRSKVSKALSGSLTAETRMLKEVSKEKPMQAPRHPSTAEAFKNLVKENPELQEIDKIKDPGFLKMLHDFKVDSVDIEAKDPRFPWPDMATKHANRKAMYGALTSDQILQLFSQRQNDPVQWTSENIAKTYRINKKIAEQLLNNYSGFNLRNAPEPGVLKK